MAVVLRVTLPGGRSILLCADQEYAGFRSLLDARADLRANILVYPHHGGLTGAGDEEAFARELAEAVRPELVIFSHGRDRAPKSEARGRSGCAQCQYWPSDSGALHTAVKELFGRSSPGGVATRRLAAVPRRSGWSQLRRVATTPFGLHPAAAAVRRCAPTVCARAGPGWDLHRHDAARRRRFAATITERVVAAVALSEVQREELLYDIKGGSLRSPPAPAAGGRKRPSSRAPNPVDRRSRITCDGFPRPSPERLTLHPTRPLRCSLRTPEPPRPIQQLSRTSSAS